ncbi:MAG: molecular chaperone DjlA [Alphaproteobacteria bacterium]|nr:molecular chaperone DjlA [Alphaproteobacteria bacterium]HCP00072.1 molecular chaperone DjlA [Rhodospirillaceae bacterium]
MSIWGKVLGGAAGFAVGGPLGALLGGVAGHIYDSHRSASTEVADGDPTKQVGFTIAVIALGAKLAKADGVVTPDEIRAFRRVFKVAPEESSNVARVFNMARKSPAGYEPYARQVAGMFRDNPAVLEELLNCLFIIAKADGEVHDDELIYLQKVSAIFGFTDAIFARIREENMGPDASDPYTVLGVGHDTDDDAIKSAYRKLVRENHPDTLIAQGMPEEFVEVANEKLATVNASYDKICAARGIN